MRTCRHALPKSSASGHLETMSSVVLVVSTHGKPWAPMMRKKNITPKIGFQSTWSMKTLLKTTFAVVPGILPSSMP